MGCLPQALLFAMNSSQVFSTCRACTIAIELCSFYRTCMKICNTTKQPLGDYLQTSVAMHCTDCTQAPTLPRKLEVVASSHHLLMHIYNLGSYDSEVVMMQPHCPTGQSPRSLLLACCWNPVVVNTKPFWLATVEGFPHRPSSASTRDEAATVPVWNHVMVIWTLYKHHVRCSSRLSINASIVSSCCLNFSFFATTDLRTIYCTGCLHRCDRG